VRPHPLQFIQQTSADTFQFEIEHFDHPGFERRKNRPRVGRFREMHRIERIGLDCGHKFRRSFRFGELRWGCG